MSSRKLGSEDFLGLLYSRFELYHESAWLALRLDIDIFLGPDIVETHWKSEKLFICFLLLS